MNKLPIKLGKVLLPKKSYNYAKWSVVACDQFTSNPKYWEKLKAEVGEDVSSLNLVFPECYLSKNNSSRIEHIISSMNKYINDEVFEQLSDSVILVDRTTSYGKRRRGLMVCVDLDSYSFAPQDKALIRATEGTVLDRIPPRVEIRKNCPLELPHIMLLIDDQDRSVIEPLFDSEKEIIYDFDLSGNGGHITGYKIGASNCNSCGKSGLTQLEDSLSALLNNSVSKYGEEFLFAVGDGNHSLATAKACWENTKRNLSASDRENHPAKFALVEVVNIYDEGLVFEPIHRIIKNVDVENFLAKLNEATVGLSAKSSVMFGENQSAQIYLPSNAIEATAFVQNFLDKYVVEFGGEIDYIHGIDDLRELSCGSSVGIELAAMDKQDLFKYVVESGVLPRKTFSMGEATEKRYYLEARKITL